MPNKPTTGAFDSMKHIYPVSKTLAFRLVPEGETERNLHGGVIENDTVLANDLKNMKEAADTIHKDFIESVLSGFHLKYLSDGGEDSVQEYVDALAIEGEEERTKKLEKITAGMKKAIAGAFAERKHGDVPMLRALASEALAKQLIPSIPLTADQQESLSRVQRYTTILRDYFTTRNRMYQADGKGNTIPNRIVDDNLPIHLRNIHLFGALPFEITDNLDTVFEAVRGRLDAQSPDEVFCVSAYPTLLTQSSIDAYNTLIGGYSLEDGTKVQGVNELVNLYNQQHPGKDVEKLKKLQKQILSDRISISWIPRSVSTDEQVVDILRNVKEAYDATVAPHADEVVPAAAGADTSRVWVDSKQLGRYSNTAYGDRETASIALTEAIRRATPRSKRISDKGFEEKVGKLYKERKAFSVKEIDEAVAEYTGNGYRNSLVRYIIDNANTHPLLTAGYAALEGSIAEMGPDEKLGQTGKDESRGPRHDIKAWLDALNDTMHAVSVFTDAPAGGGSDAAFANAVRDPWNELREVIVPAYRTVRNFLTKKPYSTDKLRLLFGNPILLAGWDANKEADNRGILFRKGNNYYIGILTAHSKKLFAGHAYEDPASPLQKIDVKFLPNPHMMLAKVGFSGKAPALYGPSEEVLALKRSGKAVADYTPEEVALMVDYYKRVISMNRDWDVYGFTFRETPEYRRLFDFFRDVARQNTRYSFRGVSEEYVMDAVRDGDLYLFQITCQDMSPAHHGKDGNYKAIFEEAFTERNGRDGFIRLAGNAAIYYRKASLKRKVTHPAGVPIGNKNPDNPRPTRTLAYDLIKDRRFTIDRYMIHLPVEIDPCADPHGQTRVNRTVHDIIRKNPGMYVLGVNRGERSLVNIAVTAPDGRIVEQRNLNVFDGFDYRRKLAEREHERNDDRQNWNAIRDIRNLKEGYLSRVICEIVKLQKKYGCVIAMERLDNDFVNDRKKFERNVYEQFERDLIGRFGLLMDKNDPDRTQTTLQLTALGKTAEERTKYGQNGIVFFVSPRWITKTDPLTGFANRLDTRYSNIRNCEKLIEGFDSFRYDADRKRFVLSFSYGKAAPGKEAGDPFRTWEVETHGIRIVRKWTDRNGITETDRTVDLTAEMRALLDEEGIAYAGCDNLLPYFYGKDEKFWKRFLELLRLTLRNTDWNPETREYRIVSCTADANGRFFDSRTAKETMPKDADILAAWNIARKAHMILRNIREYDPFDPPKDEKGKERPLRLSVRDEEWFAEVQG